MNRSPGREATEARRTLLIRAGLVLVVVAGAATWLVTSGGHREDRAVPAAMVDGPAQAPAGDQHAHGGPTVPTRPLTASERSTLRDQLRRARTAIPGSTVADAVEAGWEIGDAEAVPYTSHLALRSRLDGHFDAAQPEQLLTRSSAPDSPIVAVVYWIQTRSPERPAGFAGPTDQWHHHQGAVCDSPGGKHAAADQATCRRLGGRWARFEGWMLHVWVVPGWRNPAGVFAAEDPCLTGSRDTACPRAS